MAERAGEKNAYYCEACGGYIVTVNRDDGVTPSMLACRVAGEPSDPANTCRGSMTSMWYPPEPWPERDGFGHPIPTEPTHEWYAPELKRIPKRARQARTDAVLDHVSQGGLLLRRIEVAPGSVSMVRHETSPRVLRMVPAGALRITIKQPRKWWQLWRIGRKKTLIAKQTDVGAGDDPAIVALRRGRSDG